MSKESWISSDLKNWCQVRLHRQTDTSCQVSVISDRQPKAMKKWHQVVSFDFLNNLLMSCKELIWFYAAKIDGHAPARPSPRGIAGVQIGKQFVPGSHFPRGTASGCGEEAEPPLQLSSIHPHCLPLSKMRQKTHCSPKRCSACSLWHRGPSPTGEEEVSPCSDCHHQGIAQWDEANRLTWSQTLLPLSFSIQVKLPSVASLRTKS